MTDEQKPLTVDVAMIGHFAKDILIFGERQETSSGGAVYYGGVALRRLDLSVAVITRLGGSDFPLLDALRDEGIQVFATAASETSGIENRYFTADMDRRICKPLGFAGPFRLEEVPDLDARLILIGPIMAGEVDLALLKALAERAPIALDAQGFVRVREGGDLVFRDWLDKAEGLSYARYLKVDSAEAEVLTGLTDRRAAARTLAGWGPAEIVLTHAEGVLVYAEGQYHEAPFIPRSLNGRTGRGDTCFATYLGQRLSTDPAEACRFAAAATSLKLERPGPLWASRSEVERLVREQYA